MYIFCFQIIYNRLVEMMKSGDAGIFFLFTTALNDPNSSPIFPNFQTSEIAKRHSSKLIQNLRKLLGALKFGAVIFQAFSPCQICVAPAHKGDIRASYAVPQVALNSRGSLDFGWAIADRRKRGAPSDSVPSSRPRQRSRPSSDREGMLQTVETAAVSVLVLSTGVTSVVVHCLLPKPRQIFHEPRRLDWEEHTADINRRGALSEDVSHG